MVTLLYLIAEVGLNNVRLAVYGYVLWTLNIHRKKKRRLQKVEGGVLLQHATYSAIYGPTVTNRSTSGMLLNTGECIVPLTHKLPRSGRQTSTTRTALRLAPTDFSGTAATLAEAVCQTLPGSLTAECRL